MVINRRLFLCSAAGLAGAAVLPAGVRAAEAEKLRIGMSAAFQTLDPHEVSNAPMTAYGRHIFDSLVNLGPRAENQPQLAKSWRILDPLHWELELRDDVQFHDGAAFTAEDAIASLLRARDKPSQALAAYTRSIASVKAVERHKILIETRRPDPLLLNSLGRIRIVRAQYAASDVASFDNGTATVGTGPFKYVSYMPGDRLVMARNEAYFDGASRWAGVTLRMMPDNGARLASLLTGDVDIIEALPAEGTARVEANPGLHIIRGPSTRLCFLAFDVERDASPFIRAKDGSPLTRNPLKDERVRRAILMSLNREAIVDRVMQKNGTVADQFMGKGALGHSDAIARVPFNPERARQLLAEAGWQDGFKITIHGPSGRYVKDSDVLQAVGQMMSRIGIDTSVEVMPWTLYNTRMDKKEFSLYFSSWGNNTGEISNPAISNVATADAQKGTGRYNRGGISDPEIDALLEEASSLVSEKDREPLLQKVSELTFSRLWILPLYHENSVLGARKGIDMEIRGDKYTLAHEVKRSNT